ncbi:MAG: hypothetical protein ACQEQE_09195 [Bacillota bacterium]
MSIEDRKNDSRIETKFEIQDYLTKLKYALTQPSTRLEFLIERKSDAHKKEEVTNKFTIENLFPDEVPNQALRRELNKLKPTDYIKTVKDRKYPDLSEMRVFGKMYAGKDVYIKIRVDLLSIQKAAGGSFVLVMSFHFSQWDFTKEDFPYKNKR